MKRILAVTVALLVLSAFLGYSYHRKSAEAEDAKSGFLSVSNTALFCLTDMDALVTMVENNVSDSVIRERVGRYTFCSLVLSKASASLYEVTGKKMYWNLHVASANLADFFSHVRNSEEPRKLVAENLDVLLQIDREISGMYREWGKGNVTEDMTSKLLSLTEGLSW